MDILVDTSENKTMSSLKLFSNSRYKQENESDVLGFGSYGLVAKCHNIQTKEILAVKQLRPERGISSSTLREIVLLGQLQRMNAPNIIKIRDVVTNDKDKSAFSRSVVLDFAGTDLRKFLKSLKEKLPICIVQDYAFQILQGLSTLHSVGIIHRDLKPSNILIQDGVLKIADFGLARSISPFHDILSPEVVALCYRSPELLLGKTNYSYAVDIWSVGCVVAELITGSPMFQGISVADQLSKIFKILGTPSDLEWPDFSKSMENMQLSIPKYTKIDFKSLLNIDNHICEHFLTEMLQCNPAIRRDVSILQNHKFIQMRSKLNSEQLSLNPIDSNVESNVSLERNDDKTPGRSYSSFESKMNMSCLTRNLRVPTISLPFDFTSPLRKCASPLKVSYLMNDENMIFDCKVEGQCNESFKSITPSNLYNIDKISEQEDLKPLTIEETLVLEHLQPISKCLDFKIPIMNIKRKHDDDLLTDDLAPVKRLNSFLI